MDTIFYNNSLAKALYGLLGNKSYAIGPFIITALESGALGRRTLNHLVTYTRQWTEIFMATLFIGLFGHGFSMVLIFASILMYYILYSIEFIIRNMIYLLSRESLFDSYGYLRALDAMSFEREAMEASKNPDYHMEMSIFNWVRYLIMG